MTFARFLSWSITSIVGVALWVWVTTTLFWFFKIFPREVGAYVSALIPLAVAVYLYIKHFHSRSIFQYYLVGVGSGAAVVGAALYFVEFSQGGGVHLVTALVGSVLLLASALFATSMFRGDHLVSPPRERGGLFLSITYLAAPGVTMGMLQSGMNILMPVLIILAIATCTALVLEFWPTIRPWLKKMHVP